MLVTPDYCVMMARYNIWQNTQMRAAFETLSDEDLRKDRKAFFGSILATANHILWGDRAWLSRLGVVSDAPEGNHMELTPDAAAWADERAKTDNVILDWAQNITEAELARDVYWRSVMVSKDFVHPYAVCVTHLFNHQTHHRGQIHAMLTAAGAKAPVTDVPFMPDEGDRA